MKQLYATTDAAVWAKEWCKIARKIAAADDDREVIDEGWMITWFANAMCVAEDHAVSRAAKENAQLRTVAEASSRFRHFADQINAYIANPTAGQDAAKGAWLEGLHAAQADVDAALDALDAAP